MNRKTKFRIFSLLLMLTLLMNASPLQSARGEIKEESGVTVYFPNWNVYSDAKNQVKNLPWDRLDGINHAFWKIVPQDGGYAIVSTDPWADTDKGNPNAHFSQYAECAKKYPNVKILLSIGGWTCCGYFSEMAASEDGRASFIQSCVDTLKAYTFLSGIDIDWEYPGVSRAGGSGDEGNPVKGDDKTNYTLLLKEMRAALDNQFGKNKKQLTVCASASSGTLSRQDYASLFPYVDRINVMTYDMTGAYNAMTGHHSALYGTVSADTAVKYLMKQGVPASKIAIGSPLYSHGWKIKKLSGNPLGAPAQGLGSGDKTWSYLQKLEKASVPEGNPGWHMGFDEKAKAAYLWNDDPNAQDCGVFYTYESSASLEAKLAYIRAYQLGGLIVWQAHGDSAAEDWPMITQMYQGLH